MTINKELIFSRETVVNTTQAEAAELHEALSKPSVIRYLERTVELNALSMLSEDVLPENVNNPLQFIKNMAKSQGTATLAYVLLQFTEPQGEDNGRNAEQ